MATGPAEPQAVRNQVEEILKSPGFARNERLSGFLRFIVEQHLEGRGAELKESVIGTEVYRRTADYNTKSDDARLGAIRRKLGLPEAMPLPPP